MKCFLAVLLIIVGAIVGIVFWINLVDKPASKYAKRSKELSEKHLILYLLMSDWVQIKQKGESLASYFERHNLTNVIVYGNGRVGNALVDELGGTQINVLGIIDKSTSDFSCKDKSPFDEYEQRIDAIIVTPVFYFDEICGTLKNLIDCPIISIDTVICELKNKLG